MRPARRGVPIRHDPRPHADMPDSSTCRTHSPDCFRAFWSRASRPQSFYETDADGRPQRAHYDGLPVDFVAESVVTLAATSTDGYRSFDVMNPYDDGISLDTFVDWLIDAGHKIARIDDYDEWLHRFETALTALPDTAAATQCAATARRVSQAGAAGTGLHRTDRGVSRRRSRGQGRCRRRHPAHLGVADRQVRCRPAAPRSRLIAVL